MVQALIAGVLVSIACTIAGIFIILRGPAFIGGASAHRVAWHRPGFLAGLPRHPGGSHGATLMIGGVTLITQRSRLSSDTAIGLLFVGMPALGVTVVSRLNSFAGDLTRILFGEILGISVNDILFSLQSP